MNKPKLKVTTYRRYLGPALYDLIRSEQAPAVSTNQVVKLVKKEA